VEKLAEIDYKNPPYSIRYPKLPAYLDGPDKGLPYGLIQSVYLQVNHRLSRGPDTRKDYPFSLDNL
jgi:hypothetical protein